LSARLNGDTIAIGAWRARNKIDLILLIGGPAAGKIR
jgi:hypothetical protein